jgi:hypothetical protein
MTRRRLYPLLPVALVSERVNGPGSDRRPQGDGAHGANNHGWQVLSAHYETILEETGRFEVDVVIGRPSIS